MSLEKIIRSWQASEGHDFFAPATDETLDALEQHLGQALPMEFRTLYGFSDGFRLVGGDLSLWHIGGGDTSLWESPRFVRDCGHILPDEVLVFGDDGSDALFGIWLPRLGGSIFSHPIVEIGQIFEPGCMAVAATSLVPFLIGRTAYYLLTEKERPTAALDELGLPADLRFVAEEMEDDHFAKLRQWADPQLPEPLVDPYESKYDADALRGLFSNDTPA